MIETNTAWTCLCGSQSRDTWSEEVDPDWSKEDLLQSTRAGKSARDHVNRRGTDRCVPTIHYEDEQNPYVQEDHEVLVVRGTIESLDWDPYEREGTLVVKGLNGERYPMRVLGQTVMGWTTIATHPESLGWHKALELMEDGDVPEACTKPAVFRIVQDEEPWLFTTTTTQYKPLDITDVEGAVQEALPESEVRVIKEPTGQHGGKLVARLGEHGPFELGVIVDAGSKSGRESSRAYGYGTVLVCDNELTLEARGIVKSVPSQEMQAMCGRRVHKSGPIDELIGRVEQVRGTIEKVQELAEVARETPLSRVVSDRVLRFYVEKNRISNRTKDEVLDLLDEEDIAQEPGTLYGLAMAVTWLGTHGEVASGVSRNLERIGGELFLVSSNWDEFLALVEETLTEVEAEA